MKSIIVLFAILLNPLVFQAQTIVWQENFANGCALSCLGSTYVGANGSWSETIVGTQGLHPNKWYVSCAENNTGVGNCSGSCISNSNETLHIGMGGGAVNPSCLTGDCGAGYALGPCAPICSNTNVRLESPNINLSNYEKLSVSFNYIEGGDGSLDNASVWYYDGDSWMFLADPPPTTNENCGSGNGMWSNYTVQLPQSADKNPNVKLGFYWINNDDNIGNSVSFAVDDIKIELISPVAAFTTTKTSICQNNCISFSNTSSFGTNPTFFWNFGNGQTSSLQHPGTICYSMPGTYTISLTVTDVNGTNTKTAINYLIVNEGANAGSDNSASICNNNIFNLSSLLVGATPGGNWEETSLPVSNRLISSSALFDASCMDTGMYTFNYIVSFGNCKDTAQISVNVISCGGPKAAIGSSSLNGCIGKALVFEDKSCGTNIDKWLWSFGGGIPGTANTAGPHAVIFNTPGIYNVLLVVSDAIGTDSETIKVTISGCGAPVAAFIPSSDTLCSKMCLTINNNSTSTGSTVYEWSFEGATPSVSNLKNPGEICYDTLSANGDTLTIPIILKVTNAKGSNIFKQSITIVPPPTISVCCEAIVEMGQPVGLKANPSSGNVSWSWLPENQGNIISCQSLTCDTVNAYPIITTDFIAKTITKEGCEASTILKVLVDYDAVVGLPNTFSPNGNHINDVLRVKGVGISELSFKIYNRYGQLVFETSKVNNEWKGPEGWDGSFNGKDEQSGTFLYMVDYTLISGESGFLSGNVTLIR